MSKTTAIVKEDSIRSMLETYRPRLTAALAQRIPDSYFLVAFQHLLDRKPQLLECTKLSLMRSLLTCAQLGLPPDGVSNRAHLVPFRKGRDGPREAQFMLGYMGAKELAERHPDVKRLYLPVIVYEHDTYSFELGMEPKLGHIPSDTPDRGHIIATYCVAEYVDGTKVFRWLWKYEVDEYRARSRAKDDGPWVTDYEPMTLKTIILRLAAYLPKGYEVAQAFQLDRQAVLGEPQDFPDIDIEIPQTSDEIRSEMLKTPEPPPPTVDEAPAAARKRPDKRTKATGQATPPAAAPPAEVEPKGPPDVKMLRQAIVRRFDDAHPDDRTNIMEDIGTMLKLDKVPNIGVIFGIGDAGSLVIIRDRIDELGRTRNATT